MWILQFLRGRYGPNIHTRDWRAHCVRARVLGGCVCVVEGGGGGRGGGAFMAGCVLCANVQNPICSEQCAHIVAS